LDYGMLQQHIGANPGNRLNSPLWVQMLDSWVDADGVPQGNAVGLLGGP
jgi:hypothetical protein